MPDFCTRKWRGKIEVHGSIDDWPFSQADVLTNPFPIEKQANDSSASPHKLHIRGVLFGKFCKVISFRLFTNSFFERHYQKS